MAGGGNAKHAILTNTITQQLPVSCNRPVCPESECGAHAKRKKRRVVASYTGDSQILRHGATRYFKILLFYVRTYVLLFLFIYVHYSFERLLSC